MSGYLNFYQVFVFLSTGQNPQEHCHIAKITFIAAVCYAGKEIPLDKKKISESSYFSTIMMLQMFP